MRSSSACSDPMDTPDSGLLTASRRRWPASHHPRAATRIVVPDYTVSTTAADDARLVTHLLRRGRTRLERTLPHPLLQHANQSWRMPTHSTSPGHVSSSKFHNCQRSEVPQRILIAVRLPPRITLRPTNLLPWSPGLFHRFPHPRREDAAAHFRLLSRTHPSEERRATHGATMRAARNIRQA